MKFDAEANLQAEIYHQARLAGLPLALEVTTPAGRHDAVVLNPSHSHLIALIECKRSALSFTGKSSQIERYKRLGLPLYTVSNSDSPALFVQRLITELSGKTGATIAQIEAMDHLKKDRLERRKFRKKSRVRKLDPDLLVKGYNPWA